LHFLDRGRYRLVSNSRDLAFIYRYASGAYDKPKKFNAASIKLAFVATSV